MLDAREINNEIDKWEYLESSYDNYAKLANLYIIRDHMNKETEYDEGHSAAPAVLTYPDEVGLYGDTDFLNAIAGKHPADVWGVMDDLMDTLRITNPRVYNGVMRKIGNV